MPLPAGAARRLGDPRMRIPGHINALQFSPTGTTLVSATSGELRGWDPRTGKVLFRLDFPSDGSVDSGRLTSRDTFLLMVRPNSGQSHELRQYAFGTGKLVSRSPGLKFDNSQRTAFAADGTLMAAVHNEALAVHDTATGKEKWRESLPAEAVTDCQFFPDGSAVAVAGKGEVRLFAAATGKPGLALKATVTGKAANVPPPGGGRGRDWVSDLAISADGKWLAASVGEDEDVVLCWDVKAGPVKHQFRPAGKPIGFSPDGSELATVSRRGRHVLGHGNRQASPPVRRPAGRRPPVAGREDAGRRDRRRGHAHRRRHRQAPAALGRPAGAADRPRVRRSQPPPGPAGRLGRVGRVGPEDRLRHA